MRKQEILKFAIKGIAAEIDELSKKQFDLRWQLNVEEE